jgi:hypothetical protein
MRISVLSSMLLAVTAPLAAQSTSLVYTLGTDTVAVEQYTRSATLIEGEMVSRGGQVVQRISYRMTIGRDGYPTSATVKRMQADGTPFPMGFSETRYTITADSTVRETVLPDSTPRRAFAVRRPFVSFPVYVYGPLEALAALRRRGTAVDSMPLIGGGNALGSVGIQSAGGDTVRLAGSVPYQMRLRFDARDRLLLVDGSFTTNKVVATRGEGGIDIAALAQRMRPTGVLSVRETARAGFGPGGMVLVDYGRPHVRERTVWGGTLVPFDSVWRAGANDATHLFTTRTLTFGDLMLPPGSYTLWVQHTRTATYLIVNRQTGQWGTQYDAAQDLGRVALTMAAAPSSVEEFLITVRAMGATRGAIELSWGDRIGTAEFGVTR